MKNNRIQQIPIINRPHIRALQIPRRNTKILTIFLKPRQTRRILSDLQPEARIAESDGASLVVRETVAVGAAEDGSTYTSEIAFCFSGLVVDHVVCGIDEGFRFSCAETVAGDFLGGGFFPAVVVVAVYYGVCVVWGRC